MAEGFNEQIINTYKLGDIRAIYVLNVEAGTPELLLLPEDKAKDYIGDSKPNSNLVQREHFKPAPDSLVQVKIVGDAYQGSYANGVTLRESETVDRMLYKSQHTVSDTDPVSKSSRFVINTCLEDDRGLRCVHTLSYVEGGKSLRSSVTFLNDSNKDVTLELLSSFSIGKISPFMKGDGYETLRLHRIRSVWSMEGRHEAIPFEDLQLEQSWTGHAVRCERFGCVGSLPVERYFPAVAVEDTVNHIYWGAQLAHNCAWQMEVYRRGDDVQISGGIADREFGHWTKNIAVGESFTTPEAILSVCSSTDEWDIFQRMTSDIDRYVNAGPADEQELPVMFNEYCTTWGVPSHKNITEIVNSIKGHGFEYFVIDAGWYKKEGISWDNVMGDYEVSKELFPEGIDATVKTVNDAGMRAGLWFEIDNVAKDADAYKREDMLLKRDGITLTTKGRRFWDLRKSETIDYLTDRVIGTLRDHGFSYIKIDCNDTYGIGCDGAESLGEGMRLNQAASIDFIRKIKKEIPDIIVENCASGGHKLEPLMMSECSMASFSDAHEENEIPLIAANLHRVILPRQSQIWAAVRRDDSIRRIVYLTTSTMLGRMCISGDVWQLNDKQWEALDAGIAFYKKAAPIIKNGFSRLYGTVQSAWHHPKGYQALVREGLKEEAGRLLMIVHGFEEAEGLDIRVPIPEGYKVEEVYSHTDIEYKEINAGWNSDNSDVENDALQMILPDDWMGAAVLMRRA